MELANSPRAMTKYPARGEPHWQVAPSAYGTCMPLGCRDSGMRITNREKRQPVLLRFAATGFTAWQTQQPNETCQKIEQKQNLDERHDASITRQKTAIPFEFHLAAQPDTNICRHDGKTLLGHTPTNSICYRNSHINLSFRTVCLLVSPSPDFRGAMGQA